MICSICTEFCENDTIMDCGHKFHTTCLMNWFEKKYSCPNCRLTDPIKKEYILDSEICGCGSCTMFFTPSEIDIWICDDRIPLCPHCYVDCVFPFNKEFSVERMTEFLKIKNIKSFEGVIYTGNEIRIGDDVAIVVNVNGNKCMILTHFYRSKSFDEYFELS